MKQKIYTALTIILMAFINVTGSAQSSTPITHGYIEYEKKVNQYELIKETIGQDATTQKDLDNYKSRNAQFEVTSFKLYFNNTQTLYVPPAPATVGNNMITHLTSGNTVYSNLSKGEYTSQKKIYDDLFLIKGKLNHIKWKITNETREITGYECRRANAIILDSVYVVAFYTVDIVPQGGPELFNGLPGMILGIALPHEHISWFAKTVSAQFDPTNQQVSAPVKGKEVSLEQLKLMLISSSMRSSPSVINTSLENLQY